MAQLKKHLRKLAAWLSFHRHQTIGVLSFVLIFTVAAHPALAQSFDTGDVGIAEHIALWLAEIFSWISQQVVGLIVAIIDALIVPIMQYSHFVDSPIVTQGWTVVRDLVNMFFVVVLLIIAFQTIFSIGRADWKHQVPRLLIMAVVINFSRTIAGLLIDFGQVVMFTFVNAISNVAGGNFIQLFGLDKLFVYSDAAISLRGSSGNGVTIFDFFGAAFLTMIVTFIILATMLILAAILAFRIVILWCLVIISPLTFFLGGAKGVVGPAEGYYAEWWKRFTSAVSVGPILTFFVWLALAAASTGNLSEKQMFVQQNQANADEAANVGGQITETFDAPHLTSLIIAIAFLFAGIEVSSQTASSMGGRAGTMAASGIKGIPGLAKSLAKVGVPAGMAVGGAGLALGVGGVGTGAGLLSAAGMSGLSAVAGNAAILGAGGAGANWAAGRAKGAYLKGKHWAGAQLRDMGKNISQVRIPGFGQVGRVVAGTGAGLIQGVEHTQEHDLAEAQKAVAGMDTDTRLAMLDSLQGSTRDSDVVKRQAIVTSSLLSKDTMAQLSPERRQQLADIWYTEIAGKADDATIDKVDKVFRARPELASGQALKDDPSLTGAALEAAREKEIDKYMATNYTKRSDVAMLKTDSVGNQMVRNVMRRRMIGDQSMMDLITSGQVGSTTLQETLKKEVVGERTKMNTDLNAAVQKVAVERAAAATAGVATTPALTTALNNLAEQIKKFSAEDIRAKVVSPAMMANPEFADNFAENASGSAFAGMRENPALMVAYMNQLAERSRQAATPAVEAEAQAAAAARAEEAPIEARRAAAKQAVNAREVDIFREEEENAQKQRELQAIDRQYDQEIAALRSARPASTPVAADPDLVKYTKAAARAGQPPLGYDAENGRFNSQSHESAFREMVSNNPTVLVDMNLKANEMGQEIGRAVAKAMDVGQIEKLMDRAVNTSGTDQIRVIEALKAIKGAILANKDQVADASARLERIVSFQKKSGRS